MPDTKELVTKEFICFECDYKDVGHTVGADTCPVCGGSMEELDTKPYDFKQEYAGRFV
jgi:hypothetical protein